MQNELTKNLGSICIKREANIASNDLITKFKQFNERENAQTELLIDDISEENSSMEQRWSEMKKKLINQEKYRKNELDRVKNQLMSRNRSHEMPDFLKNHKKENPQAFYIQVIGGRGAGKSTFVNKILKELKLKPLAATGSEECTLETDFFTITEQLNWTYNWKAVFLCDQPGIGGLKIKETNYLERFGIGELMNK